MDAVTNLVLGSVRMDNYGPAAIVGLVLPFGINIVLTAAA
jgi:hypothetical protein